MSLPRLSSSIRGKIFVFSTGTIKKQTNTMPEFVNNTIALQVVRLAGLYLAGTTNEAEWYHRTAVRKRAADHEGQQNNEWHFLMKLLLL